MSEKTNELKTESSDEKLNSYFQIDISVRQLVEFIFRSGDIDNRRVSAAENAMQAGSKIHRMIQRSMGENYSAEVLLRYKYKTDNYCINIEGRADGIIQEELKKLPKSLLEKLNNIELLENKQEITEEITEENELSLYEKSFHQDMVDLVTIDEIKCISKKLDRLNEPILVHLAQAKVYAYIYLIQNNLDYIRVRMTYCNLESLEDFSMQDVKYFYEDYTRKEIVDWFNELMASYKKWADFEYEWMGIRQASIKNLEFPFEYRDGQRELVVNVYNTILKSRKLYIEAPTGVGKTISTLFPAVKAIGEGQLEKIFYLTAKTITRTVAEDTINLLRNNGLSLKSLSITAKDKICPLDERECNPLSCPYAKGHYDRINDAIYFAITNYDSLERNSILEIANNYMVCPFEMSLDISLFSDAVICDYNYVFDPHANLKRFFTDGMMGEYAFLIDEAHNLVDRGREMFSASLYKEDFLDIKRKLKEIVDNQPLKHELKKPSVAARLVKALERCNKELLNLKRSCDKVLILDAPDPFVGLLESLSIVMNQFLEEENDSPFASLPFRKELLDFYFEISHFLLIYEKLDDNYVIYCELQSQEANGKVDKVGRNDRFMIKLFCVNPTNNLKEAMSKGRTSILFSATFLPIQYYKNLLGGSKDDFETYAKSTFDNEKRGLFIAKDVTSKYSRRNDLEYHKISAYIFETVTARKGNYMVFFPSHAFLANVLNQFKNSFYDEKDMELVVQEEFMNEEMREAFLQKFDADNRESDSSLIGFCVLGGIFSEGIDLKRDSLIGCIVVGTGLPMVCNEREILKDYFDDDNQSGFDYAYRYPGMNKVLQAAGRVIRTMDDVGVVELLDDRFMQIGNRKLFPREWSNYRLVSNISIEDELNDFWHKWKDNN